MSPAKAPSPGPVAEVTPWRRVVNVDWEKMAAREIKVGAFVLAGLVIIGVVVFLIGQERQLFAPKVEYKAVFENVEGLKRGSPVRMGGVDVGIVDSVGYSADPNDPRLYVTLEIVTDEARRIRNDSVASIEGKGLLGDKMVTIEPGTSSSPRLPPHGTIPTKQSKDLTEAISRLGSITGKVEHVLSNLESTTGAFADEELHEDFKSSVESISEVLKSLAVGDGYAARLLHDPAEAQRLSETVANLNRASAELAQVLEGLNQVVARVNEGPGLLHSIVYDEESADTVAKFGDVAGEAAATLRGVREGNGLARSILYGDDESQAIMGNLNRVSADVAHIVADVRAGKGTLGALLVDPSVYEDLKILLGNVGRNRALRALVRYSIEQDDQSPGVEPRDTKPASGSPAK